MILKLLCIAFIVAGFCEASPLKCPCPESSKRVANTKANPVSLVIPKSDDELMIIYKNSASAATSEPKDIANANANLKLLAIPELEDDLANSHQNPATFGLPKPEDAVENRDDDFASVAISIPEDVVVSPNGNTASSANSKSGNSDVAVLTGRNPASFALPEAEDIDESRDDDFASVAISIPEDVVVSPNGNTASSANSKSGNSDVAVLTGHNPASFTLPEAEDVNESRDDDFASVAISIPEDVVVSPNGNTASSANSKSGNSDVAVLTGHNPASFTLPEAEDVNESRDDDFASVAISIPEDVVVSPNGNTASSANSKSGNSDVAVLTGHNPASFTLPEAEDVKESRDDDFASVAISIPEDVVVSPNGNTASSANSKSGNSDVAVITGQNPGLFAFPEAEDVKESRDDDFASVAISIPEDVVVSPNGNTAFSANSKSGNSDVAVITGQNPGLFAFPEAEDVDENRDDDFASVAISIPEDVIVSPDGHKASFVIPRPEEIDVAPNADRKTRFLMIPEPEDDIDREDMSVDSETEDTDGDIDETQEKIENISADNELISILSEAEGSFGELSVINGLSHNRDSPSSIPDPACCTPVPAPTTPAPAPTTPATPATAEPVDEIDVVETIDENTDDLPAVVTTPSSVVPTENPPKLKGLFKIISDLFHKRTNENAGNLNREVDAILEAKQSAFHAVMNLVGEKVKLATSIPKRLRKNLLGHTRNT